MPRPKSFTEFNAKPTTGPTYTDLARENAQLREQVQELTERMRKQVDAVQLRQSGAAYARQQAFLELAQDLADMEPAARDAAIRRIIDNAH